MNQLYGIPEHMDKWGLGLEVPFPSEHGEYQLVDVQPASVEGQHEVWVIDENERPLRGVAVIFGFSTGPTINHKPRINLWRGAPVVLKGNIQWTNFTGGVTHTFKEGGEDIWVWDVEADGVLRLPSPLVRGCKWVQDRFVHTGVELVFKRNNTHITPEKDQIAKLEQRIERLENGLGGLR